MNTVWELFPHIHTEGFHCAGQGHVIFTANSRAVCQPNVMQIRSNIIVNSHCVLCVKAFTPPLITLCEIETQHSIIAYNKPESR